MKLFTPWRLEEEIVESRFTKDLKDYKIIDSRRQLVRYISDKELGKEIIKRVNEYKENQEILFEMEGQVHKLQAQNRELVKVVKKAISLILDGADGNALYFLQEVIEKDKEVE